MTVKHPHWQCPRCGTIMFWFGATSHLNRCREGEEPWREALRRAPERGEEVVTGPGSTSHTARVSPPDPPHPAHRRAGRRHRSMACGCDADATVGVFLA